MKKFVLLFSILLFLLSILSISANAYEDMGSFFVCYNCSDCTDALNNNTYSEVRLNESIYNQTETCINNPENFTNKIFDCQGNSIIGNNSNIGIYLEEKENNTIENCTIRNFAEGIFLKYSNNTLFIAIRLNDNIQKGFHLYNSNNNTFTNCESTNNSYGFHFEYFSNYNLINDTKIYQNVYGIHFLNSINNTIKANDIISNNEGIHLEDSSGNNLTNNNINVNEIYGVYLVNSYSNNLVGNIINKNKKHGIYIKTSNHNLIENNYISYNEEYGLYIYNCAEDNSIINNTLQKNKRYEIYGWLSSEICCNNFVADNIGSDDKPIGFYNESVNLENEVFAELILCNSSDSNLNNITIIGDDSLNNNGLILIFTKNSNLTNINSSKNMDGIVLFESESNNLVNTTTSQNFETGLLIISSKNNFVSNLTAEVNYVAISLFDSSYNNILFSKINSNVLGLLLFASSSNYFRCNEAKNNSFLFNSSQNSVNTISNLDIGYTISFEVKDVLINKTHSPASDPSGYKNIGKYLYIANTSANNSWIYFNISYQESELGENDESTLRIFRYDTSWTQLSGSGVDTLRNYVYSGNVTSFSVFAPMVKITTTGGAPGGIISRVPAPNITQQQNQTNVTNQTACKIFNLTELSYYPNYTLELSICDEVIFALNEKTYNLTLVEIKNNSVVLRLDSITITLTNVTSIDLDEDEIEDLSIKLEKISEQNVTLTLSPIPKPEEREEKKEEIIPPEKKEEINWNLFVLIFIIFFLLLVLIFLLFQKSKETKRKKKH